MPTQLLGQELLGPERQPSRYMCQLKAARTAGKSLRAIRRSIVKKKLPLGQSLPRLFHLKQETERPERKTCSEVSF